MKKRNKIVLILLVVLLVVCSCKSSQGVIPLPSRPTLESVTEPVPIEAQRNTLKLIAYIERLELICKEYSNMVE